MSNITIRAARRALLVSLFAVGLAVATAEAEQPPAPGGDASATAHSIVIEEVLTRVVFQNDGSGSRTVRTRVLLRDRSAVEGWGELSFPYMAATETVALKELTVVKPDGRRVGVPDPKMEDVTRTGQIDEPTISDWRMKRVTVPTIEPGDRLVYEVETRRSASLIPGHFWADHWFLRAVPVLDERFEVDTPAGRALQVSFRRGEEDHAATAAAGRVLRRWRHRVTTPSAPADQEAVAAEVRAEIKAGPDVRVSSFENWAQVGAWFGALVDKSAVVDATVRAKAQTLIEGKQSPREKLDALYAFVSSDIRYVSLAFGAGRFEPRPASLVLSTQYGDCKDKHTLLAALASAAGLSVRPVLISSLHDLIEKVPTPNEFDHVVSLAGLGSGASERVWMDSTSGVLPTGVLLANLRNRRAILAGGPAEEPLVKTSEGLAFTPVSRIDINGRIADGGEIAVTISRRLEGDGEYLTRLGLRSVPEQARPEVLKQQSKVDGLADGSPRNLQIADDGPGRGYRFSYDVTRPMSLEQPKAWTFWLPTPSLAAGLPDEDSKPDGEPFQLGGPAELVVNARYETPATFKARPPIAIELDRPFASYRSRYAVEGRALIVERRLVAKVREVSPADWPALLAFRRAIDADFRQTFAVDAIVAAPVTLTSAEDYVSAGRRANDNKDYPKAIELLRKATDLEPNHKTAWINLGYAYRSAKRHAEALSAFERQVAIDPYQKYAYAYVGASLWISTAKPTPLLRCRSRSRSTRSTTGPTTCSGGCWTRRIVSPKPCRCWSALSASTRRIRGCGGRSATRVSNSDMRRRPSRRSIARPRMRT